MLLGVALRKTPKEFKEDDAKEKENISSKKERNIQDTKTKRMKDKNCPYCVPQIMGMSPEGLIALKEKHDKEHCVSCPTCGKPLTPTDL